MINLIFLIITLVVSLTGATIFSYPLVVLLVIAFNINLPLVKSFFYTFLTGLLLDLFSGHKIGPSSLLFLLIALIISLYKSKYSQRHIIYSVSFTFLCLLGLNYLFWQKLFFIKSLITSFLIIPFNFLISQVNEKLKSQDKLTFEI